MGSSFLSQIVAFFCDVATRSAFVAISGTEQSWKNGMVQRAQPGPKAKTGRKTRSKLSV